MVLCDDEGAVYDIGSMYESKAYRIRKTKSKWFRELAECYEVYGDKAYKYVEGVIGAVKSFNAVIGGVRALRFCAICMLTLLLTTSSKKKHIAKNIT